MDHVPPSILRRLETTARGAARRAYAPYSQFPVGAAILAGSGKIYSGCNVENASYGLSNCAERSAIFSAVTAGERTLDAVLLYTPTPKPVTPCGACRQVINEFGPHALVVGTCASAHRIETTLAALLPQGFGPQNLLKASPAPVVRRAR